VHYGAAPEKVYPGPINAPARSYKWLLETLGLRIDPLGDGAEPRPRCIARLSDRQARRCSFATVAAVKGQHQRSFATALRD